MFYKGGYIVERKKTRLSGYDYTKEAYYYVTLCTHRKMHLFGDVNNLNIFGKLAEDELLNIPKHFTGIQIDKHVIMPNHLHAVIVIGCTDIIAGDKKYPSLSTIIGSYKSGVSRQIHRIKPDIKVWQTTFYDHIIRNEQDYNEICRYIDENPAKWTGDEYYI
jgi:REP element-mobilizing transposase RayT